MTAKVAGRANVPIRQVDQTIRPIQRLAPSESTPSIFRTQTIAARIAIAGKTGQIYVTSFECESREKERAADKPAAQQQQGPVAAGVGHRRRSVPPAADGILNQHRQIANPGNPAEDEDGKVIPPRLHAVRLRPGEETEHVATEEVIAEVTRIGMLDGNVPPRADDCRHGQGHCGAPAVHEPQPPRNDEISTVGNSHQGHACQPLGQNGQPQHHAGRRRPCPGPPLRTTRPGPTPRSRAGPG